MLGKPAINLGLTALSVLFFLSACEDAIEVTSDLNPSSDNSEIKSFEFTLPSSQIYFDSIATENTGGLLIGQYENAEIGSVEADGYASITLDNATDDWPFSVNATLRSFSIHLSMDYYLGTDFANQIQFDVYELESEMYDSLTYFSFDTLATSRKISNDNLVRLLPADTNEYEFNLSEVVGNELLQRTVSGDSIFASQDNFDDYFKGIKISSNNNLVRANLANNASYLSLRYTVPDDDSVYHIKMNLSNNSFSHLERTSAGTLVPENLDGENDFQLTDDSKIAFIQGIGVLPKLSIDPYLSFMDTIDILQINKAELIIDTPEEVETNVEQYRPPQNVLNYYYSTDNAFVNDITGTYFRSVQVNGQNQLTGSNPVIMVPAESGGYSADISFFMQDVKDLEIWDEEYSLVLYPSTTKSLRNTLDHFVVDKENIRIKIYYTTFK